MTVSDQVETLQRAFIMKDDLGHERTIERPIGRHDRVTKRIT